jgi:hypothetical protein
VVTNDTGGGVIDIANLPLLVLFTNVKLPVPLIFESVIGIAIINIIASFFACHFATAHHICRQAHTHESKFVLLEHPFQ